MGQDKNDKFEKYIKTDAVFLSGIQALVELPKLQIQLDRYHNHHTAALISGYRGSPLGGYDQMLWKHEKELKALNIVFQPGLNEDLAATALWGTQMQAAFGPSLYQGVFGIWYGKGPGVDRTGDVFRTANMFGTSALGGVLAIAGDDHTAQSSTFPHQTDGIFQAVAMPILQPSNLAEVIHFGLAGIALSRYSGLWVALKTVADVIEAAGSVRIAELPVFLNPAPSDVPLNWDANLKWPAQRAELEKRLIEHKIPAAKAWARCNAIDRVIYQAQKSQYAIVSVGKAHQDLMQALNDLGLTEQLEAYGISMYKVGMSWPLEETGLLKFTQGHTKVLVLEEKRSMVEQQIKQILYHSALRPEIFGKTQPDGTAFLPEIGEYSSALVAQKLFEFLGRPEQLHAQIKALTPACHFDIDVAKRSPFFCSGCPHNTSTRVPEGSMAGGGIGCHIMALVMPDRHTNTFSQMGGEGMQWVGAAPFSQRTHIFQNLGDGTYEHSGILAIRAAIAANTNITFKILYNDAVAMTGGQPAEGNNDPARISRQLAAEGVQYLALVSENPNRWQGNSSLAAQCKVYHRDELSSLQQQFQTYLGVSVIIYDQTCAAEKRRRRKQNTLPSSSQHAFIHDRVCEGCGDCSVQSNCISIEPLNTAFGTKRKINQSSCNQDLSCLKGFCPSFVEIEGQKHVQAIQQDLDQQTYFERLIDIQVRALSKDNYNMLLAGVGGTGVLTIAALLGKATVEDQHAVSVLDFTGLSQKNGAVFSQVRLAQHAEQILSSRIGDKEADVLIATDLLNAASNDMLQRLQSSTQVFVNLDVMPTAALIQDRDQHIDVASLIERIETYVPSQHVHRLHANQLCEKIFAETTFAHILMLGFAWQKACVPISLSALKATIRQGVAPQQNLTAFQWGRVFAMHPELEAQILHSDMQHSPKSWTELVEFYRQELLAYQNEAYAQSYRDFIEKIQSKLKAHQQQQDLMRVIAEQLYRLMAYKDEYEVARLYSQPEFKHKLAAQFQHTKKLSIWLAPPLLSRIDPITQRPKKIKFGAWVLKLMPILANFKWLRGQWYDPLGRHPERVAERQLIRDYMQLVEQVVDGLNERNMPAALELCGLVNEVRGFGPVKMQALKAYQDKQAILLKRYHQQQRIIPLFTEA